MRDPSINEAFRVPGSYPGLLQGGNINLQQRPVVKNPHGGYSTVDSVSFGINGHEVLLPTVVGGRIVTPEQALAAYQRTGQNLGTFKNAAAANQYAQALHRQQAAYYGAAIAKAAAQGRG